MSTKTSIDIDVKFVIEDLKRKTEELVENKIHEKKNENQAKNSNKKTKAVESKTINVKDKIVNGNNLNVSNILNNDQEIKSVYNLNLPIQIKTNEVAPKIQTNTLPKVMPKNNKRERKLLPKSSLSINNSSINNLNIKSGSMQVKTTNSLVTPTNTTSSFFATSNIINFKVNKEMPKLLPKTTQAIQEQQSLPLISAGVSNKKDIILPKRTVKPKPITVVASTPSTTIASTCAEKSVKEVVTNLRKISANEFNSSTKTTNTIDTVMSEVLQSAVLSVENSPNDSGTNSQSFLNLKSRKRAPARSRLVKKVNESKQQAIDNKQKTTSSSSFFLPNMIFPNQLTLASGNLVAVPGCVQQFVIQPTLSNQQSSQNTSLISILPSSQHDFLAPRIQQQSQQFNDNNQSSILNSAQNNNFNKTPIVSSSNTSSLIPGPVYFQLNPPNNNLIAVSGNAGAIRNSTSTAFSQLYQSNLKFIQPKSSMSSVSTNSGNSGLISRGSTTKNSNNLLNNSNSLRLASSNSINNTNVITSHPQIVCLPHPQQQKVLSNSLNSQQLAQFGNFPIMTGTGSTNTSQIIQFESLTNNANNFAMYSSANPLIQNQHGRLLIIDADIKNDQNDRLQASISSVVNAPSEKQSSQNQKRQKKNSDDLQPPPLLDFNGSLASLVSTEPTSSVINFVAENNNNNIEEEENEPPPLLCQDNLELVSMQNSFYKEAVTIRQQLLNSSSTKKSPIIKHFINGFVIEESSEPFPCEYSNLLYEQSVAKTDTIIDVEGIESSDEKKQNKTNFGKVNKSLQKVNNGSQEENDNNKKNEISKKNISEASTSSTILVHKKRGRRGGNCELKGLLMMDFGPGKTPFQTTSIKQYTEEVILEAQQQQRCLAFDEGLVKQKSETQLFGSERNSPVLNKKGRKRLFDETRYSPKSSNDFNSSTNDILDSNEKKDISSPKSSLEEEKISEKMNSTDETEKKQIKQKELWGDERCISCQQKFFDVKSFDLYYKTILKNIKLGKRHPETPQYCSKKCRKKSKKQQKVAKSLNKLACETINSNNVKVSELKTEQNTTPTIVTTTTTHVTPEKVLPKILPSTSFANSSPPTALSLLRQKIGVVSSPFSSHRNASSAFTIKNRTPQKSQQNDDFMIQQNNTEATASTGWQSQLQLSTTLGSSVPIAAAMMAVQSNSVGLSSGLASSSSNMMPFIPNIGQFTALNNGLGSYPLYDFQQHQQSFTDSFYQQQLQRKNLSTFNQQSLNNPIMMFSVAGSSSTINTCQSPPTLTPSITPQTSLNPQIAMKHQSSNSFSNNNSGSNISSPRQSTPHSSTLISQLQLSDDHLVEIQQIQAKRIENWTVQDVARWSSIITNSYSNGERFLQNEIDGNALILLNTNLFESELGIKLGPALKLNGALNDLIKPQQPSYQNNPIIETLILRGVKNWTTDEVKQWVNIVTNSDVNGEIFVQKEIDGASLKLLDIQKFKNNLEINLGTALKLNAALAYVQSS